MKHRDTTAAATAASVTEAATATAAQAMAAVGWGAAVKGSAEAATATAAPAEAARATRAATADSAPPWIAVARTLRNPLAACAARLRAAERSASIFFEIFGLFSYGCWRCVGAGDQILF